MATYGIPGSGGRQPVYYAGSAPEREDDDAKLTGRRPVVAIMDTGCGKHAWLRKEVVTKGLKLDNDRIGYMEPLTDPEKYPDLIGQLDGVIDPLAGHGTFIAGLVHQACPNAKILSWRVVPSTGPIIESDWITALAQVAELVDRYRNDPETGQPIDVLSLSMGYYHETPYDELFDPTLYAILEDLSKNGTLVVCSAGNDATARPSFPAAFAPWLPGKPGEKEGPVKASTTCLPIVSVGARNPADRSDALFSNAGRWVRAYTHGAALVSTIPPFQGGLQPPARTKAFDRWREAIDPDDFRGGFAVWSGTSFAAPLLAGRLATYALGSIPKDETAKAAVDRWWTVLGKHLEIKP